MSSPALVKTRAFSPKGYRYTYADPKECGPVQPLRLEFWIPKGRKGGSWVPNHAAPVGNYKAWRKVRQGHSHADKLAHSIAGVKVCGYAVDRETKVKQYLEWAQSRGLTCVHAFNKCPFVSKLAPTMETVRVDPADFIGPAPAAEECEA